MSRRAGCLGGFAAGLGLLFACSRLAEPVCPNGVLPWDGQSDVPLDTIIELDAGGALPSDLPDLSPAIEVRVQQDDGRGHLVPFTAKIDADRGRIRLVLAERLEPDTTYEVSGIAWYELADGHWWGGPDDPRDYVTTTFRTGGGPEAIDVITLGDEASMVLVFSEPVELGSVTPGVIPEEALATSTSDGTVSAPTDTGGEPGELAVVGYFEGQEHLVLVEQIGGATTGSVAVAPGLLSRDGAPGREGEPLFYDLFQDETGELVRFDGAAYCLTATFF